MLQGIVIKSLKRLVDERGSFAEIMRKDWHNLFGDENIVQANLSVTFPNTIRAWHRHRRGQIDYFVVIQGAIKLCAYDENIRELDEFVLTGENLQIIKIPGHYWHGFKVLSNNIAVLVYFVNKLYDYEKPDEERRPWNDKTIIPKIINGKRDDPRCDKPWDWFYPPHR